MFVTSYSEVLFWVFLTTHTAHTVVEYQRKMDNASFQLCPFQTFKWCDCRNHQFLITIIMWLAAPICWKISYSLSLFNLYVNLGNSMPAFVLISNSKFFKSCVGFVKFFLAELYSDHLWLYFSHPFWSVLAPYCWYLLMTPFVFLVYYLRFRFFPATRYW